MTLRKGVAVAAVAALGFGVVSGIDGWTGAGEALAKPSNGMAGGNGNNGNGAGNGNGGAQPRANIAPVADAGRDQPVLTGQSVTLDGSASFDGDGDPVSFYWELVGAPAGSAAQLDDPAAVRPTFTVDLPGDYEARLVVDDGLVASVPDHVILSTGNVAPAANGGADIPATTGVAVVLDGAGSTDANGDAITYGWRIIAAPAGSAAAPDNAGAARTQFVADVPGDYVAELTVRDGAGAGEPDRVTVSTGNVAPAAGAGADLVFAQPGTVALDAELSADAGGDALTFRWTVLRAPENARYQVRNSTSRRAFLLFEDPGDYVVQLTVTDAWGAIGIDTALVTGDNARPVADAGPDKVLAAGAPVQLDASGSSDANGDLLTARWALVVKPEGSAAILDTPDAVQTGFTADLDGTYVAQLIVDDGTEQSAPDTVVVTTGNVAPVADAGPDLWVGPKDGAVVLDGAGSRDANGDELSYRWSLLQAPRGSKAELAGTDTASPRLVSDRPGTYLVQLIVNDGTVDSAPAFAVIAKGYGNLDFGPGSDQGDGNGDMAPGLGHDTNLRPVADAGTGQTVPGGAFIQLDGGASHDPNGHDIAHEWALIFAPAGSAAALDDPASPAPSFTADVSGIYVAQLVVRDSQIASFPDTVLIYANTAPVADAGPDQEVVLGTTAILDGTGSFDPDGDALGYEWTVIAWPAGGTRQIDDAGSAVARFTPDVFGIYEIQLIVDDGIEDSAPDTAIITIVNTPPVAEAGDDQSVIVGDTVTLDGTGSYDPDGQDLTYSWRFTARPRGSTADFGDATSATPSFTAVVEGLYIAELTVNDGVVDSYPDVVGVRVGSGIVNNAPVLDDIGDQMVMLGSSLRLTLTASDPDGDAVYFNAAPLPLPEGAGLDAVTGVFTYRPTADQVGSFTLTFTVSDGLATDSESVQITVMTPPPGTLTSLSGRLLDADTGGDPIPEPVRGATVSLVGTGTSTTSDDNGNFLLSDIPDGNFVLDVNGATADPAPDGKAYGAIRADVSVIAQTTNEAGDFYVPRLDTDAEGFYEWFRGLTINNTRMGVSLTLPRFLRRTGGGRLRGWVSISDMPAAEAAPLLPPWISACQVLAIKVEPYGQVINAWISLRNRDGLVPGSEVDIWNLNPSTGEFKITGTGRVRADGEWVETVRGRVTWATLVFMAPVAPRAAASVDMNAHNRAPTLLADGNVSQAIALPGVISLGQDRSQTLIYNSALADPRPIVSTDTTIFARTGVPPTIESLLDVGGMIVAGPAVVDTNNPSPLPEDEDATIRHALQFDAGALETGIHPYRFTATAKYACSTVSHSVEGEIIVDNESDSPFGAGWTLDGLERLHFEEGGDILLSEGDGSAKTFDSRPDGKFHPPIGIPAPSPGAGALDDFNGDGNLDMAVPGMDTGVLVLMLGDGTGEFPLDRRFAAGGPRWTSGPPDVHSVATGDFNNDGIRDLVVNNQLNDRVRIYLGRGDGTFQLVQPLIKRGRPQGVGVADFDGDGNDDFVVATAAGFFSTQHQTFVYFGDGTGNFPRIQPFDEVEQPINVAIADFDNNGAPDFAVASGKGRIYMMLNDGAGNFVKSATPVQPILWVIGRFPLAAADFNGDGIPDLAATVDDGVHFAIYFGDGFGGISSQLLVETGIGEVNSVTATDYDEDGDMDVVASGRITGAIVLFEADGAGNVVVDETVPLPAAPLHSVRAGDFNHDDAPDIQTGDNQNIYVLIADRSGGNRFRSPGADFSTLERNDDGTYVRRMTDGTTIEYNEDGLMTARVDANGNRTEYSYNADGLLTGISDPADPSRSTTFDYQGGSLSGITDLAGRTSFFQVGADGKMTSFQDAESNIFRYAYDGEGKLTAFASARGFVTSIDYGFAGQYLGTNNPDGTSVTAEVTKSLGLIDPGLETGEWIAPEDRIARMQDPKGSIYEFEVNEYGHAIRFTDPIGRTTLVERDADNLVTRTIAPSDDDPSGTVVTELDYDDAGNVTAKTEGAGTALARTTRFEYEPDFNRTTKIVDPAGGETVMQHDPANGNLLKVTDAEGGVQEFTYDPRGLRETAVDQNGNITRFKYNFFGNIETSTNGAGDVTKMLRDNAGNVTGVTEGFGTAAARTTSYEFDNLGRIVKTTAAEGGVSETVYDADGNTIAEIDAIGIAATSEYDVMGRLATESHPATGTVTRIYDENGNMASMIDGSDNVAHFEYDEVNRATRTQDPAGGVRLFAYDARDKPIRVTDANGNATYFRYDLHGREIERRNALGNTWTFRYDSRDNMTETVDAKGQTIEKGFDALSRMTRVVLIRADGSQADEQVFAYDDLGQKTLAYDNDSSLAWTYDAANRVATAAVHGGLMNVQKATVLTHGYDEAGNRRSLADSEGGDTLYRHDGNGNLTRVTLPSMEHVELSYDPADRLTRIVAANTVETQVLYDALTGRPDSIAHTLGAAELARFDYGFDTDGTITSIADGGGTRTFTYDEALQLTGGGYPTATEPRSERYAYDAEGNRTSSHLSGFYEHDAANRLIEDEDACYAYDANGNLERMTARVGVAGCIGEVTEYTWDVLNRLTRIDNPDGTYAAYRYDAQGRRIEKDVNGALIRYIYDGDAILLEYDEGDALQSRYTHGEEVDQPLAMARGGQSYFYGVDHLGSVRLLTNAAGAVANRYDYDVFGNLEATSFETVANPFGFTARERDAESGLMFYRARYYDPKLGRFISEDPIGFEAGDLNLYRYVSNLALMATDPSGEIGLFGFGGTLIGAGVILGTATALVEVFVFGKDTCGAIVDGVAVGVGFALGVPLAMMLGEIGAAIFVGDAIGAGLFAGIGGAFLTAAIVIAVRAHALLHAKSCS